MTTTTKLPRLTDNQTSALLWADRDGDGFVLRGAYAYGGRNRRMVEGMVNKGVVEFGERADGKGFGYRLTPLGIEVANRYVARFNPGMTTLAEHADHHNAKQREHEAERERMEAARRALWAKIAEAAPEGVRAGFKGNFGGEHDLRAMAAEQPEVEGTVHSHVVLSVEALAALMGVTA